MVALSISMRSRSAVWDTEVAFLSGEAALAGRSASHSVQSIEDLGENLGQ
jgi:hypothetical protein